MAQLSKDQLKAIFKAGSKPTEAQFASLIESNLNLIDTGSLILAASALNISGASIGKTDIDRLRQGKSISGQIAITGQDITYDAFLRPEAIFSTTDDSTYQKFTVPGRVGQFVSGNLFFDQNLSGSNNYIALGKTNTADTQFRFSGNITASGNISASSGDILGRRIFLDADLIHSGDEDTKMTFSSDNITFNVGTINLLSLTEDTQNLVTIGNSGDVDFQVKSGETNALFVQGSSGNTGLGLNNPGEKLTVIGNISSSGTLTAEDVIVADDLSLTSDSSIFNMGAGNDFTITHDGTTGATIQATPLTLTSIGAAVLAATGTVTLSAVADIILDTGQDIVLDAGTGNIEFKDSGTTQLTLDMDGTAGAQVIQLGVNGDDLVFKQFDGTTVFTIGDDQIAYVEEDLKVGDDIWLSSNGGTISFGSSFGNVSLTHVVDTGLLLGGTAKLQFNDASQFIHAPSATVLDIAATDEIELTATLIDVVGNLDVSGTTDLNGPLTVDGAGISLDSAGVGANFTVASDGDAEDLTIAVTGATNSSLILSSTGTGADALQITTTAGGIDISATGNAAGEDIDISSEASVNVTATENAANAIYLRANGGTSETIKIHSDQGTGASSIQIKSDVGGIDMDSAHMALDSTTDILITAGDDLGLSAADVINIETTSADGHIVIHSAHTTGQSILIDANASADAELDIDAGILDIDVQGVITIDGTGISLDSTATLNIDNSNTSNGITIGTATSGVPISVGHTTSETTVNDNLTVTGTTTFSSAQVGQRLTKKVLAATDETLTAAESGKLCLFSSADGATVTLPDSGDGSLVGVYYDFYVADQLTSGNYDIRCTDTTNEAIIGFLHFCDIDTNPAVSDYIWRALASDSYDQIQMNGTTTGTVGTFFRITNIAPDKWMVNGNLMATGTPSTPFVAN